jgi:ABC-2 type transport system permease protein
MLNPMANIVMNFQRAIYKHVSVPVSGGGQPLKTLYQRGYSSYLERLGAVIVISMVLVWLAQRVFARAEGNFAQEL